MSNNPITINDLLDALRKMEAAAGLPKMVAPGARSRRRPPTMAAEMKTLMDKYDISDNISGKNIGRSPWSPVIHVPLDDTMISMPYMPLSSLAYTYSGVNRWMAPWFMGVDLAADPDAKKREEERKRQQEKERFAFDSKIDCLSVESAVQLSDPNPKPAPRIPDYTHTLTGWRGWEVEDGFLAPLGTGGKWKPRQIQPADCKCDDYHDAPAMACSCGYWSFKSLDLMKKALHIYRNDVVVVGPVEIWGRVIECENGFRSEYAYPKELWLLKPGLESLSYTYGIPIRKIA